VGADVRHHLAVWLLERPPTTVLAFLAMADEVDLEPLLSDRQLGRHRFALVRTPEHGHDLTLHHAGGPRERHPYGMAQPSADAASVADGAVGVVLTPGVVFDRAGRRLGRGGGYYDRLLARLGPGVVAIGVTAAALVVAELPDDDHDVAVGALVTEDGLVAVSPPSTPGAP